MKVRKEIELYADDADKTVLLALFDRYHWSNQWSFVAYCEFVKKENTKWGSVKVWKPTEEGRILYKHLILGEQNVDSSNG